MSTIPIYMDASLQRMLVKDMEQFQLDTGKFPGLYTVSKTLQLGVDDATQLKLVEDIKTKADSRVNAIGMSTTVSKTTLMDNCTYIATEEKDGKDIKETSFDTRRENSTRCASRQPVRASKPRFGRVGDTHVLSSRQAKGYSI